MAFVGSPAPCSCDFTPSVAVLTFISLIHPQDSVGWREHCLHPVAERSGSESEFPGLVFWCKPSGFAN